MAEEMKASLAAILQTIPPRLSLGVAGVFGLAVAAACHWLWIRYLFGLGCAFVLAFAVIQVWKMFTDPMYWFSDLKCLRRMEGAVAECHLSVISQALGENTFVSGFAIDLGSQSGFIPGEYQTAFPSLTVIPTDLPAAEDEAAPVGLMLMQDCLARLAADHRAQGETERQQLYEKLWARARAVDVLDARWVRVAEYEKKCALVTCTSVIQMKAMETPFMWRQILLGAARLLQPGGVLVVKDQAPDGFSDETVVKHFAIQLGMHLELHQRDGTGLQKVPGSGEYCMFFRRSKQLLSFPEDSHAPVPFAQGHVAEVIGLRAEARLNGLTAVLVQQVEAGRWRCQIGIPTEPGMRQMREVILQSENLAQLMPQVR